MHDSRARTITGSLTVTLTLIGWSSVPLFLRYFTDFIDAWTSNGWRYGISALLWAPLLVFGYLRGSLPRGVWRAAVVPSIVNAVGQVVFCYTHYKIDPGLLTFGLRSQMFFAAIGAYIMFAIERPVIRSPGYLMGAGLVLAGTAGAMLLGAQSLQGDYAVGVLLSLFCGGLFAGYALAVRRYMMGFSAVVAFAVISQYTAAAMVLLMVLVGARGGLEALSMPAFDFGLLLVSGIIGIALGHVLYYMSIARLGVAVSSGVLQLHPFTVAIASLLLFGEEFTTAQWASGFTAVAGAILMLGVHGRVARKMAARPASVEVPSPQRG